MKHRTSVSVFFLFASTVATTFLSSCSKGSEPKEDEVANDTGGSDQMGGAENGSGGSNTGGSELGVITLGETAEWLGSNQCGVAAKAPADTGACRALETPLLANFDDFTGAAASAYTYYVNGAPPAAGATLGGILHVGDGSDVDAASVISTEMVAGAEGSDYALQIANDNAVNWGGLLMFYFPGDGVASCLDAKRFGGIEFSIKGSTPSGNVGVSLNMLDTIPTAESGLCDNASADDCKHPTITAALATDPDAWTKIRIPWSAFTPGIGSDAMCIPNTGENIVRLVVQALMVYAPPDYMMEAGPYALTIDDVGFYGESSAGDSFEVADGECPFPETIQWSATDPIIAPVSDDTHDLTAVKDPSIVRFEDTWHVFASSVSTAGAYNLVYTSFADFSEAPTAPLYHMDQTPGFDTYVAAPQVFYFTPQARWYLVYQSGPPMYSWTDDITDPASWSAPAPFYASTPDLITEHGGGWLDYWVICDGAKCHLFFSSNQGRYYRSETSIDDYPEGFGEPVLVFENSNHGRVFEGSNVYKIGNTGQFLAIVEAFDQTSNNHRYFRSWLADELEGPWFPWQSSGSFPFAGSSNVTFEGTEWTLDISHGEMVRSGYDETLTIDPCNMQYIFQGADPLADSQGDYNKIPWHLGLLTQVP